VFGPFFRGKKSRSPAQSLSPQGIKKYGVTGILPKRVLPKWSAFSVGQGAEHGGQKADHR
jgi:hypothetical protein